MPTDVFVDFSAVPDAFDVQAAILRLASPDMLGGIARGVTCAVAQPVQRAVSPPRDWTVRTSGPVAACRDAMAAAAQDGCSLLVLLGDVQPSSTAMGLLLEAVDTDPMVGFAAARLTGTTEESVARLDFAGDSAIDELPRRVLAEIPETYLCADTPSRCLMIKAQVVADFGELDDRFDTLAGALWHYMVRARRCGFRTLVCNRAVVRSSAVSRPAAPSTITARALPEADRVLLRELWPDVERTAGEFGTGTAAITETRLARALYREYGAPPSLLLDLRNIGESMNGTAVAALGISGGLHAVHSAWDVTLLASKGAAALHRLSESFPGWSVATELPERQFTAALRLSQPWNMQEMIDLNSAALFNAYLFLDTISWDVGYPAPHHLDGTWRFMAEHADALLFISRYTRDRFRRRFAIPERTPELVTYLSFDPADYRRADLRLPPQQERFILVVGNQYDHKDIVPTTELLATAFPYESIVAIGPAEPITPRVKVLESGTLSEVEMHRLYAGARLVVFPSFYEGFGLPILSTLAYGGTLLARRSALLDEIAARCVPHGRIIPFARRDALVDIVGRLLHGEDVEALPLGTAIENGRPISWEDSGQQIFTFLDSLIGDLSASRWRTREHTIAQLMAAPLSLVEKGLQPPRITRLPSR